MVMPDRVKHQSKQECVLYITLISYNIMLQKDVTEVLNITCTF